MTANSWFVFILAGLATWRVTHLLAAEDGPAGIVVHVRKYLANSFFGTLMDCFGCMSLWVAAPLAFFVARQPLELVLVWLALSGGAMLVERIVPEPLIIERNSEPLEGDRSNDVLR
jgi:hypothetical protein